MRKYNVAVVGATGAVGEEIFDVLTQRNFPIAKLVPLASASSIDKQIECQGAYHRVKELTTSIFEEEEIDIAFFSAGGDISAHFAPHAAQAGAVVIDNTSHFRMDENVPLVVPECNPEDVRSWRQTGIIANPNCSTIQMVHVLKPLDDIFDILRVDVSTYQAVSGAGKKGLEELVSQMKDFFAFKLDESKKEAFVHQIALNVIPHIDKFTENGYTKEEMKMINETQKILHKNMAISATCVRVPVLRSHSEAISIHCRNKIDLNKAKEALFNAQAVVLEDMPSSNIYPMPIISTGTDETYVGRIRVDNYDENILHLWCSADQLRVGAATNAVKIAEIWAEHEE